VNRHLLFHDLIAALETGACPVCQLTAVATERRLRALFHESVNDPGVRAELRASLGFCRRHGQQALSMGDPLGVAILYAATLAEARRRLELAKLRGRFPPRAGCPLCETEMLDSDHYVEGLAAALQDPQMQARYADQTAGGLCIHHMERVLAVACRHVAAFLCDREGERLAGLAHEMGEFIRKQHHEFAHEPLGEERDAVRRAVQKAAGVGTALDEERLR